MLQTRIPAIVQPSGEYYPKYTKKYQSIILKLIISEFGEKPITQYTSSEWYKWVTDNSEKDDVLLETLRNFPNFMELVVESFQKKGGAYFKYR